MQVIVRINGSWRLVDVLGECTLEDLLVDLVQGQDTIPDRFYLSHLLLALLDVAFGVVIHPETDSCETDADSLN